MNHGPELQCDELCITLHGIQGAVIDDFLHDEGKAGLAVEASDIGGRRVWLLAEHHAKERRLANREVHIDLAHDDDPVGGAFGEWRRSGMKSIRHVDKSLGDDFIDDFGLVSEVPVGRCGGNTGTAASIGQAEIIPVAIPDQVAGGVNQGLT